MPSSSRKSSSRKGKTHVFPYEALNPILSVDSKGNVSVSPLEGSQPVSSLPLDMDRINDLINSIREFPIRKFEKQVGDVQDAIRDQTRELVEYIGKLRLDGNYAPLIEQHRQLMTEHKEILMRLSELSTDHSGNAQVVQGFKTLSDELKNSIRYLERLTSLEETVTRLQAVSLEFSRAVSSFTDQERNWEKMDVVLSRQEEMMREITELRQAGMTVQTLTTGMEEGLRGLKESIKVRLDTLENVQKEIQREITQFSTEQKNLETLQREVKELILNEQESLEDIRARVSVVPLDRQAQILREVETLARDVSSIPRINQDQLLDQVRGVVSELGNVFSTEFASKSSQPLDENLMTRLEGLRLAIEVQKIDLEQMDAYIRQRLGASNQTDDSLHREILDKLKLLDLNSRLTVIEEGIRILSDKPGFDDSGILQAIREMRPQVDFQPLLDRMDFLEKTLNHREEMKRGFEDVQRSIGQEGEEIRKIQSGLRGMQEATDSALQRQLDILSRIEMKLSEGGDQGSKILEYQAKIARCEEEKSRFEKKIGSLTMEIESLRTNMSKGAEEESLAERKALESRVTDLTSELEVLRRRLSVTEKDLETAQRDKRVIDPRVEQLEREISELRATGGKDNERNASRVRDLEEEVQNLKTRLEYCSGLEVEKRKIDLEVSELSTKLKTVQTDLETKDRELEAKRLEGEEYGRRISDLTEQLRASQNKVLSYTLEQATHAALIGKIDEEIIRNEILTDRTDPLERLTDLVDQLLKKIEEKAVEKGAGKEVVITDIPRYSVYPQLDEILVNLSGNEDAKRTAVELFSRARPLAEQRLFNYYQQINRTKDVIQTTLRESSFLHRLRNLILADPKLLRDVSDHSPESPPRMAEEVKDLEQRPLDLSEMKVGKYVLTGAFSPIFPVTSDVNRVEEVAPKIASALYRVFYIKDVLDVVVTLNDQSRNIALENELKEELAGIGKWNPTRTQILLEVEDLYKALIRILSNIRGFLSRIKILNAPYAYGLEMRYVILDAFMKALEESRVRLERVAAVYEAREALPEPRLKNFLSYVKIRGDGGDIDPRFVFKVDDGRRKLLLGHQPFVFSSAFASDSSSSGQYQYDMFGPMTRVFTPRETNEDVGDNLEEMVEELNNGRDICALALGPSGAGKTSTLLYFRGNQDMNIPPQNGAIPVMISKLSREFVSAEVKAVEMTSSYLPGAGAGTYWKEYEVFEGAVGFDRAGSEWNSRSEISIDVMDYGTLQGNSGVCEVSKPFQNIQRTRRDFGKISLANFLARLIDIRLNCGTTNNPDSSRSHLFVFIQLKNADGSKSPYLIISDLAGREKAFDCDSEAVLETLAMNRWYPELNGLIQNPIEGGLRKSSKRDIPTADQLRDKAVERSFKTTIDSFTSVDRNNLNDAVNNGYIKVFFSKPLDWYLGLPTSAGKKTLNTDLYEHVQIVSKFIVRDDYFLKKILQRFDSLDKQPEILRKILEKIGSEEKIRTYDGILKYYSEMEYRDPNITAKSPGDRLRLQVKTITGIDNAQSEHKGVIDYLNATIIVNAIDLMLYGRPKEVCGIRNIEGGFINRSLDEYSQLVMTAASIDTNYGPLIHPECMPVVCSFAGLDCLLPKNVRRDIPPSAISRVLSRGMGTLSFRPGTLFSIFLVINASRTEPDKRVRPLYDSLEIFMKKIYELCQGIEQKSFYVYRQDQNLLPSIEDIQRKLSLDLDSVLALYKSEREVLNEYRSRVEYRGTDEKRMLKTEDVQRLYRTSKTNWEGIRERATEILGILSDERFPGMDSQTRSRFSEIMAGVLKIQMDVNRKNQDTIPGALAFVDELMKRGLQPMICSVAREEDVLPPTLISSWKNALYSEDQ